MRYDIVFVVIIERDHRCFFVVCAFHIIHINILYFLVVKRYYKYSKLALIFTDLSIHSAYPS